MVNYFIPDSIFFYALTNRYDNYAMIATKIWEYVLNNKKDFAQPVILELVREEFFTRISIFMQKVAAVLAERRSWFPTNLLHRLYDTRILNKFKDLVDLFERFIIQKKFRTELRESYYNLLREINSVLCSGFIQLQTRSKCIFFDSRTADPSEYEDFNSPNQQLLVKMGLFPSEINFLIEALKFALPKIPERFNERSFLVFTLNYNFFNKSKVAMFLFKPLILTNHHIFAHDYDLTLPQPLTDILPPFITQNKIDKIICTEFPNCDNAIFSKLQKIDYNQSSNVSNFRWGN